MVLILAYIFERPFRTSLGLCYRLFSDLVFLPAFPHILFHLCTSIVCVDLIEAETICKQWSRHSCASKQHAASSHITFHWLISKNQRGITNFPTLLPTSIPGIHSSFIISKYKWNKWGQEKKIEKKVFVIGRLASKDREKTLKRKNF